MGINIPSVTDDAQNQVVYHILNREHCILSPEEGEVSCIQFGDPTVVPCEIKDLVYIHESNE